MEHAATLAFVDSWLEAWNAHDIAAALSHFSDDVVFTSPFAALILDDSDGVVRGKPALEAYWSEGLRRNPDLIFEVIAVYAGVNTLVINYRNHKGALVNEVLIFDDGLVVQGHAAYLLD